MRSVVTLVVGLAVGTGVTAMALDNLRKQSAYPHGVMAVMAKQMGRMNQSVKANACTADDLRAPLTTLNALGNDLEPAFLPTVDDVQFGKYAADFRAATDTALTATPADCAATEAVLDQVGETCGACHQQFKS
jgi:cytochrome c556